MEKKKERITKLMAQAGLCSRRDAEKWITSGRVCINGVVAQQPVPLVDENDKIVVDGKPLGLKIDRRLWCYNKPSGLITTHKDLQGRPTVFDYLPKGLPRVISVGRLDFNSEGLLLLTTDGALARTLELPSKGWKRKYRVRIHGHINPEIIQKLQKGICVNGINYAPCVIQVEENQTKGSNQWILITLSEGKNREIRNIMAHFGFSVSRLIRISYGPFQLGTLPVGEVREVSQKVLKEQI